MSENMIRTQVYLPPDLYRQLKQRARRDGVTMATQIREALVMYVISQERDAAAPTLPADDPIWELIGMGESGMEDSSANHDQIIYTHDWDQLDEIA